jgi:hypothetical protein
LTEIRERLLYRRAATLGSRLPDDRPTMCREPSFGNTGFAESFVKPVEVRQVIGAMTGVLSQTTPA